FCRTCPNSFLNRAACVELRKFGGSFLIGQFIRVILTSNLCEIKDKLDWRRKFRVTMLRAINFASNFYLNAQFFPYFPRQRIRQRFARLNFSAGEFPFQRKRLVTTPLANQQTRIPCNNRSNDGGHRLLRFTGFTRVFASCPEAFGCSNRSNSRAPSTSGGPGVFSNSSRTT